MRVIGTAGHVDHGKSALVEALTGTHPDRLKEEREREMTIDLGFAWFTLPGVSAGESEEVGIVDVPGHRDFIENMLAGVGGVDAVLFVVAADEGVMPQTREHLAILDLLQIPGGVVALTKIDLATDSDWLDLVEDDLGQILRGTVLENAPIIRVSARTRQGIPEMVSALRTCLAERPARPDLGRPRLPVDRIFTIAGFGTVVTGTLLDGRFKLGEEVEILPAGVRGRVRGLQSHKHKENSAEPGSRTAMNISGVTVDQVQRGDVVCHPGDYRPTRRLDVAFRLLLDSSQPVNHNLEVKLFTGASETQARVRLLGAEELRPGEHGWLQLELAGPVVAVRGDHYILRRPSPGETIGGGVVVDPHPAGRHKRFAAATLERLETLLKGTPQELILQSVQALGMATLREVLSRSNLDQSIAQTAVAELVASGQILLLEAGEERDIRPDRLATSRQYWNQTASRCINEVESYHAAYPLRQGMPREELKSRMKSAANLSPRQFNAALSKLVGEERLEERGPLVLRPGYKIGFSPQQRQSIDLLLSRFSASPFTPPSVKECQQEIGEELFNALIDTGVLIMVSPEVVFRQEDYQQMVTRIRQLLQERGTITAAEVRDHFNTSRRYALALLEHLDAIGVTLRDGDQRRLRH